MGVHNVAYALSSVIYHTFHARHADKRGNDFLFFVVYTHEGNGSRVYGYANVFGTDNFVIAIPMFSSCRSYE